MGRAIKWAIEIPQHCTGLSTSICNAFTVNYADLQEQTKLVQNFVKKVYNNKQQKSVASSYGASFTYIFNSSNYCYL
jgi:hypothetical protein